MGIVHRSFQYFEKMDFFLDESHYSKNSTADIIFL